MHPNIETPVWLGGAQGRWILALHVQPGAPRTVPVGEIGGRLKLKIAAPPVDGKANDAVLRWCAQALGVPRAAVTLEAGATARFKRVSVRCDLDAATMVERLSAA